MSRSDSAAIYVAGAMIRATRCCSCIGPHRRDSGRISWDLFCGHVNEGVSLEETLHREAREELGIEVRALRWLGQIYDPVEPAAQGSHQGYAIGRFRCSWSQKAISLELPRLG